MMFSDHMKSIMHTISYPKVYFKCNFVWNQTDEEAVEQKKTKHSHTPAINMTHPTAYIENIELLMHLFRWVRKPRNMANEYGQKSLNHSPNHPSPPPAIPNSKMLHRFSKYRLKYLLFVVEIYATVCRRLFIGHGVYVYT